MDRTGASIKAQFESLYRTKPPTGSTEQSAEVLLAKKLYEGIVIACDTSDLEDDGVVQLEKPSQVNCHRVSTSPTSLKIDATPKIDPVDRFIQRQVNLPPTKGGRSRSSTPIPSSAPTNGMMEIMASYMMNAQIQREESNIHAQMQREENNMKWEREREERKLQWEEQKLENQRRYEIERMRIEEERREREMRWEQEKKDREERQLAEARRHELLMLQFTSKKSDS